MDSLWHTVDVNHNIVWLLKQREVDCNRGKALQHNAQFTAAILERLYLEQNLKGHKGCVNCLQWTADGRRLASGSDDTFVRIWDPFANKCLHAVPTKHIGNIFSVKFVSDGSIIATCAGDCRVIVQSIEEPAKQSIMDCSCHTARVKRLATAPDCPTLFWSAGEDGLILQYDLREPHECSKYATAFLDLYPSKEFKCIAVNPTRPHLIAVGANDPYVRMYDRRFVKTSKVIINPPFDARKRTPPEPQDPNCVQYFSPGHLAHDISVSMSLRLVTTYVTFDATGNDLLVNMGGDHIYLYDINNHRTIEELSRPDWLRLPQPNQSNVDARPQKVCCSNSHYEAMPRVVKGTGAREALMAQPQNYKFLDANPCACEYIARARHRMQRRYIGDAYYAARDCLHVVKHWPMSIAGYLGLIECLVVLKWQEEAQGWLTYFLEKFPMHVGDKTVKRLEDDLKHLLSTPIGADSLDDPLESVEEVDITPMEKALRSESLDYETRYLGHCNTTTDIKEANFLGADGNYICAGSDNGWIFFWDRKTTNLLTGVVGDTSIVNCVQPHPSISYLATSGIDPWVKIWAPYTGDMEKFDNANAVKDLWAEVECNQDRMSMDPFDTLMLSMGFRDVRTTHSSAGGEITTHSTCRTC